MTRHTIEIDLGRIGRSSEHDKWALVDKNDLDAWVAAEKLLENATYRHDRVEAELHIDDVSKIVKWYKESQAIHLKFYDALRTDEKAAWKHLRQLDESIILMAEVSLTGKNDVSDHGWYPRFFVEKYIYDVFFIMNMAVPGSCEFLNLRFRKGETRDSERFYLSAFNFEESYYDYLDEKTIAPIVLAVEDVFAWYNKLQIGTKQRAESNIEKAIFSLLHICKTDMDVTSIVWIFHALEAIYGTKLGEGFTNLINRIAILLELDAKEQKELKKHLRDLYNYRSSFVHGGYKVHHPMRNEVIDRRLDDDYSRTYKVGQIGFNLVVASIQTLIRNNWFGIEVREELRGVECSNN